MRHLIIDGFKAIAIYALKNVTGVPPYICMTTGSEEASMPHPLRTTHDLSDLS
jgi:hypothetical protein